MSAKIRILIYFQFIDSFARVHYLQNKAGLKQYTVCTTFRSEWAEPVETDTLGSGVSAETLTFGANSDLCTYYSAYGP